MTPGKLAEIHLEAATKRLKTAGIQANKKHV